jgi:hypothetical protein
MSVPFTPVSEDQFAAMVRDGSLQGMISPFLAQYQAVTDAARQSNLDVRALLAWTRSENNQATNISDSLLAAHNAAGIYYVGQSRATPGPLGPASEGSKPYCAFPTWTDFWLTLADNINYVLNVAGGDLNRAAWYYTRGNPGLALADAGEQHPKATYYRQFLSAYPPEGASTVPDGVYGEDLIAKFETQIGHAYSGDYDPRNGNHPWAYYCRAGVESTGRNCGLSVVARVSALDAQHAAADQGLLNTTDPPEHGAVVQFDTRFYFPDGHTGYWNADKGQLLGTLTDGNGVGYKAWGPQTFGYAGWYRLPGVVGERRVVVPAPPIDSGNLVIPDNPYNTGTDPMHQLGVGGAFRRVWELLPTPLVILGYPMTNEYAGVVTDADGTKRDRTVQDFERGILIFQSELPSPWNVTMALRNQKVTKKAA